MESQRTPRLKDELASDWGRALGRLAATLAGLAIAGLCAWALVAWSVDRHVILAGMLLLLGGYLALGSLMIAVDWVRRGFRGE